MTLSQIKIVRICRWSWLSNRFLRTLHAFLLILKNIVPQFLRQFLLHVILLLQQHLFFILLTVGASEFLVAFLRIVNEFFVVFFAVLLVWIDQLVLVQVFFEIAVFFFFGVVACAIWLLVAGCAIIAILRLTRMTVTVFVVLLSQVSLLARLRSVEIQYSFTNRHVLQIENVLAPEDDGCTILFDILSNLTVSSVCG